MSRKTTHAAAALFTTKKTTVMLRGASALALGLSLMAMPAAAQVGPSDLEDDGIDEIVATGIRQSLDNAQDIKRNADVFVDAISAEDIGALPDRSVSEALQRVPGVSVLRFAGPDDPDHFSVEGSGVIIRGLEFTRSELNGRSTFAASNGGRLGFEDVSPELLGSVQVFKNQSANMIEGGLSGTIDLRTRLPFDEAEDLNAFTVDLTYSDFIEELTPSGSALMSRRFSTSSGDFGILLSGSTNNLETRADGVAFADFREFDDSLVPGQTVYVPVGASLRTQEFDRDRDAFAGAFQWENTERTVLATAQFLHSDAALTWGENVIETSADGVGSGGVTLTDPVFDGDGVLTSGLVSENVGWRGNDTGFPLNGQQQSLNTRERDERDKTTDYAFNVKFTPRENLRFNLDVQYVDAETEVLDVSAFSAFFAQNQVDIGDRSVNFVRPDGTDADYFSDPNNYFFRAAMDHAQDSEATQLAFQGDVEYDFSDTGFLRTARFGARYAEEDTDLQYSLFNWGNVSEIWTGNSQGTLRLDDPRIATFVRGNAFEDHFRTGENAVPTALPFFNFDLAENYDRFLGVTQPILASQGSFRQSLGQRDGVLDGGLFLPSEQAFVDQDTMAVYGVLDFGHELSNGMAIDGNIGVRYVDTDVTSSSATVLQSQADAFGNPTINPGETFTEGLTRICSATPEPGSNLPGFCTTDFVTLANFFGEGGLIDNEIENSYTRWLPSANVKVDLGGGKLIRFGASRSMYRPETFQLRSSFTPLINTIADGSGVSQFNGLQGETGNPNLLPIMSNQFDLSFEWYFADAGSFTVAGFTKSLEDFIIGSVGNPGEGVTATGSFETSLTNNGITNPITVDSVINAEDTDANLKGVELAYQQFYDFLPGALSGLGIQANYTYIDSDGIADVNPTATGTFSAANTDFPRISEHQFNLAGLYEKGPIQARLAYNWRDDFLLTRRDVIFPFTSIYQEAGGQLDGSIFYDVSEDFKIGVQAVNLLDDVTETSQLVNDAGLRAPRAFNRNDRRFSFILRGNF